MSLLNCNLNTPVYVKLTERGEDILDQYYGEYGFPPESNFDGYYKFQLWDLMNIFGKHMYNGCKVPFENNEIVFVK